jgi:hypothetical protein
VTPKSVLISDTYRRVDWKGYVWGAVSTALVGGMAAGAAFGIVRALEGVE